MKRSLANEALRDLARAAREATPTKKGGTVRAASTLQRFLEQDTTTDSGQPWSLKGHEPFKPIIDFVSETLRKRIPNRRLALLKAEQIGATHTIGMATAIFAASEHRLNVGYFIPDEKLAGKIGARLKAIIKRSPYLAEQMRDRAQTNQTLMKEFPSGAFLHVLPLGTLTGSVSVPLDVRDYDEVDLLPTENKEWSEGRTAHSSLNFELSLSAGYTPGAGIDQLFQEGTQCVWRVDCERCSRKGICLEDVFLETEGAILAQVKDEWTIVCPDCKRPLDVVRNGKFVAAKPRAKMASFRISKLAVSAMNREQIHNRYEAAKKKKSKLAKFKIADLALPDAGAMQPFNEVMINRMQSGEIKRLTLGSSSLPRFAGMDLGDTCHFLCYERLPNGDRHLVFVKEFDSDKVEDEAPALMRTLGCSGFVLDKKPHTNTARAIAYPGFATSPRIALMDFVDNSPLKVVDEDHEGRIYHCAKVDRDEGLDEMCDELTDEKHYLRIPDVESDPIVETLVKHLKNLRKNEERDAKDRVVHKFKKGVENHFGLALFYAYVAELISPIVLPWSYEPVADQYKPKSSGIKGLWT